MRARLAVVAVLGAALGIALSSCASAPPPPPVAQAPATAVAPYPGLQSVPQLPTTGADHQPMVSYCVLPPGSELRVFYAPTSHGDGLFSVVNTHDLAPTNPWKCP